MATEQQQTPHLLAPMLGAKRDGSTSVDTSRGLLMTILGEFALTNGGSAWTQTLIEAMDLVGVKDKASRQAISRVHGRGWLERTRVGRQTRWTLSEQAVELLGVGADRIYRFGQEPRPWDGTWLLLLASVPESDRNVRYRMGVELSWSGFGSLGQGTWLSPWPEHEAEAVAVLKELRVDATSFRGALGQMGSGPKLAGQAWDLPTLGAEYDAFMNETESQVEQPCTGSAAARQLTALVHRWRRFPFLDPELPAELLPDDWPGPAAARRFTELRAALLDPAMTWWTDREAEYTPASTA